ncbi:inactive tyrosine-protein kinase transmembrane receptor ROR1-like [Limulus polyphemus]|uniref:Inactive tyrosine-protein kinase transmembrane receptor ROR1-like n=1 Tax=Limulus polyphemus TaxID=6850 RepID=A0ABM1C084_LIMPO|nr:inactive tyrosine-protein kinase transmembrane receptor ROR1-like [Limulus polyphemus]
MTPDAVAMTTITPSLFVAKEQMADCTSPVDNVSTPDCTSPVDAVSPPDCTSPVDTVSPPDCQTVLAHFPDLSDGNLDEGICQVYRSATCSKFLTNKTVFVSSIHSQGIMEEKLAAAFSVIASSQDVSSECHKYAIPSLCFYAFPLCDNASTPKPRHVCRDECEVLENSICRLEYSIAKRHPLIGQQKILPTCEDLPPFGSKASETCVRLGVPNSIQKNDKHTCYMGMGDDYRGTLSYSVSGHKCQHWSHQIFYHTSDHPELTGGHNYCRNPGRTESQPWCFIADPQVRKEMCEIPQCGKQQVLLTY